MNAIVRGIMIGIIFVASLFLVTHFLQYTDYREDIRRVNTDVADLEKRIGQRSEGWVSYLERRINTLNQSGDEHHVFVSKKLYQLSQKIENLEKRIDALEQKVNTIKEEKH